MLFDYFEDQSLPITPIVSVWLLTFNHRNYFENSIESILSQQTNFDYEIVIGDDCSSDGTRDIVLKYHRTNPSKIRLVLSKRNYWQQLGPILSLELYKSCKGKYIATCEGDDYWTDPHKLQKQVDYLEANPECSFCFTDCQVKRNKTVQEVHPNFNEENQFTGIDFADQSGSIAQTCTWLVRRECFQNLPNWVKSSYAADWCMQLYFSKFGKGAYIPETTAAYRIHENGTWSKLSPFEGWRKNLEFYKIALKQLTDKSSKKRLHKRIQNTIHDALELANIQFNKTEIRKWLPQKVITCPFISMNQTLHSIRLLLS